MEGLGFRVDTKKLNLNRSVSSGSLNSKPCGSARSWFRTSELICPKLGFRVWG